MDGCQQSLVPPTFRHSCSHFTSSPIRHQTFAETLCDPHRHPDFQPIPYEGPEAL